MMRWTGSLESQQEYDLFLRWATRCVLWLVATGGSFAVVAILLYGPDGHPPANTPWWQGTLLVAFIGLPAFWMLGIALRHVVRCGRARRREVREGQVTYTNPVVAWVDYHGCGVATAIVAIVVAASAWLTFR